MKKLFIILATLIPLTASADSYIVKMKPEAMPRMKSSVLPSSYVCMDDLCFYFTDDKDEAAQLIKNNEAEFYEKSTDRVKYATPNDTYYDSINQWHLKNTTFGWETAYDLVYVASPTSTANVAIIDTGYKTHEDYAGVVSCVNIIKSNTTCEEIDTKDGHGSHVFGIIAADTNNNKGVAGTSFGRAVPYPYMTSYDGDRFRSADIVEALADIYNKHQANNPTFIAVNMSLGGGSYVESEYLAIQKLAQEGIIVVVATGNEAIDIGRIQSYPANYNLNNVIGVSALGGNSSAYYYFDSRYSNYGGGTNIAAPGTLIASFDNTSSATSTRPYMRMSGTSMATPYVTAVLAAGKAIAPDLTGGQLMRILYNTSHKDAQLIGLVQDGNVINVKAFIDEVISCRDAGAGCEIPATMPARVIMSSGGGGGGGGGCAMTHGRSSADLLLIFTIPVLLLIRRRFAFSK